MTGVTFNGETAETTVTFNEFTLKLIQVLYSKAEVKGQVVDLADACETKINAATPGDIKLTHDEVALSGELVEAATYDAKARPVAAELKRELNRALKTFYEGTNQ